MRFDLLLSNLLFGMTLLTAALAVAHLLGTVLNTQCRPAGPRSRALIRLTLLIGTGAFSLLLFGLKVARDPMTEASSRRTARGDLGMLPRLVGRSDARDPDDGSPLLRPRAPVTPDLGTFGISEDGLPADLDAAIARNLSWTLYDQVPVETRSGLESARDALSSLAAVRSWVGRKSSDECKAWNFAVRDTGIQVKQAQGLPSAGSSGAFILVCVSDPISEPRWSELERRVRRGGSVLFVGRPGDERSERHLNALLLTRGWSQGPRPNADAVSIILGGRRLTYGGMPSGLRFTLGRGWLSHEGPGFAEADGEAAVVSDPAAPYGGRGSPLDHTLTPLILRDSDGLAGAGRVAWTSLPPRLYGRLSALYGPYWELWTRRMMGFLARVPLPGLEALPAGADGLVIPVVHADSEIVNAPKVAEAFRQAGGGTSVYFVASEARGKPSVPRELEQAHAEVAVSALDHEDFRRYEGYRGVTQGFFSRVDRFERAQDVLRGALGQDPSDVATPQSGASSTPCCERGALTFNGMNSDARTFTALLSDSYDYAVTDPYADWTSPFLLGIQPTAELRKELASGASAPASEPGLVVLPAFAPDDYQRYHGPGFSSADVRNTVLRQFQDSRWMTGPLVLRMHSQLLGRKEGVEGIKQAFPELSRQGAVFEDARSYVTWWRRRSQAAVRITALSRNELLATVTNTGREAAEELALRVPSEESWELTAASYNGTLLRTGEPSLGGGGEPGRFRIPRLEPGQTLTLRLKRFRTGVDVALREVSRGAPGR